MVWRLPVPLLGFVFLGDSMNQVVATTQELTLDIMLEEIRSRHIDIIPLLMEELSNILPQYIKEIVHNIYVNSAGVGHE